MTFADGLRQLVTYLVVGIAPNHPLLNRAAAATAAAAAASAALISTQGNLSSAGREMSVSTDVSKLGSQHCKQSGTYLFQLSMPGPGQAFAVQEYM